MSDRFSFDSADELIQLLTKAHAYLRDNNNKLLLLFKQLGEAFRDGGYSEYLSAVNGTFNSSTTTTQQLGVIIGSISRYRQQLYDLYIDSLINQIGFETLTFDPDVRFGSSGEELERKQRQLAFQNEIRQRMRDQAVPRAAKEMFARVGSNCVVASDSYTGTAYYSPMSGSIKFNLEADLSNPCGSLSTYFHEVGHMIDFQTTPGRNLSADSAFASALREDCEKLVYETQHRYGCSREDAYYHISRELMLDNDSYADVSDILGSLTECKCQNLWGHSLAYWKSDPNRVEREAFANMYSVALGSETRIETMRRFFPSAYARFEKILEDSL